MEEDQKPEPNPKLKTAVRIIEVLIVPAFLGILAWSANQAGNKIAASQHDLALQQEAWNEAMSNREQERKDNELDTRYLELFGQYYFNNAIEKRRFAINMIDRVKNEPLRKSLAVVANNDLKENAPKTEEIAKLQQFTEQIVQRTDAQSLENIPTQAWCYQEKRNSSGAGQYLVSCHLTEDRCQATRGPNPKLQQTQCILVQGLDRVDWNPNLHGYMNSVYQYSDKPMTPPFPQFAQ